jgi:nicotinamidase-related amidase
MHRIDRRIQLGEAALMTGGCWRTNLHGFAAGAILLAGAVLAPFSASLAQSDAPLTVPPVPDPVAVTVDHATTALVVGDVDAAACPDRPPCAVTQPIATLLEQARAAGALVVFTTFSSSRMPPPANAPQPGELVLLRPARGPAWEGLDEVLRAQNIDTIVFVGNSLQQLIVFGSYELATRYGYTIVVPEDGTVGADAYVTAASFYQLLHLTTQGNPANSPLQPAAVTLSRSDLVTFR